MYNCENIYYKTLNVEIDKKTQERALDTEKCTETTAKQNLHC